jgi:hypothetical protein
MAVSRRIDRTRAREGERMFSRSRVIALVIVLAAAGVLAGCAARSGSCVWGDKDTGLILEYRMSEGDPIAYKYKSEFNQVMQAQGQEIPVDSVQTIAFSIAPSGMKGNDHSIGITIDGMHILIDAPEGGIDEDVEEVAGASFEMTLSRTGEEKNLPNRDVLEFSVGPEGPRSIIPVFSALFPDLPGRPVVVGDSWPSVVDVEEKEGEGSTVLHLDVVNTLDGFETVDGRECARITSAFTGTITGNGIQQGAEWTFESDTDGTGVLIFDFERGVVVSDVSTGTADGTITVNAPMGEMIMPVMRTFTMSTRLAG